VRSGRKTAFLDICRTAYSMYRIQSADSAKPAASHEKEGGTSPFIVPMTTLKGLIVRGFYLGVRRDAGARGASLCSQECQYKGLWRGVTAAEVMRM
jgi:hypothetical protein